VPVVIGITTHFHVLKRSPDRPRTLFRDVVSRDNTTCDRSGARCIEWNGSSERACFPALKPVELKEFQYQGDLMATTATVAPAQETKKAPLILTSQAIAKVREIMATQDPLPAGLRIGVVGGGCSGFQYSMAFENQGGMMDKVFTFDDLKVFVDATSLVYLNGCTVDYVETLEAAGFKFENPQVKSTCGCGSSFNV